MPALRKALLKEAYYSSPKKGSSERDIRAGSAGGVDGPAPPGAGGAQGGCGQGASRRHAHVRAAVDGAAGALAAGWWWRRRRCRGGSQRRRKAAHSGQGRVVGAQRCPWGVGAGGKCQCHGVEPRGGQWLGAAGRYGGLPGGAAAGRDPPCPRSRAGRLPARPLQRLCLGI